MVGECGGLRGGSEPPYPLDAHVIAVLGIPGGHGEAEHHVVVDMPNMATTSWLFVIFDTAGEVRNQPVSTLSPRSTCWFAD
jgi:hypothetical protein